MASEYAFKYFRYKEEQAFLKWKRMLVRGRELESLKELAELDMPAWKKRCLIRDVVYYSSCSESRPLTGLEVYDYESEPEPLSDMASYGLGSTSSAESSPVTSSRAGDSTTGTTEATSESTILRTLEPMESSPAEPVKESVQESSTSRSTASIQSQSAKSIKESVQKSSTLRSAKTMERQSAESVNELIQKSSISRSAEPMDSQSAESIKESVQKSSTSHSAEPMESESAGSVNGSTHESSTSQAAESMESTSAESDNESVQESSIARSTKPMESQSALSANELDHVSSASQTSESIESSSAELVNEVAPTSRTGNFENLEKASTLKTSDLANSTLDENDFDTIEEWTTSEQNTPERTRNSEDCIQEIMNLSPALSSLAIDRETSKQSETEESIQDIVKYRNVRCIKSGKLHTVQRMRLSCSTIYKGRCSNQVTALEAFDEAAINSSALLLIPSNVQPEARQLSLEFAERFGYRIAECDAGEGSFNEGVSHVLVDLEVQEPLQFAQCQAIGCKRHLIATDWLRESLKAGQILSEDSYEIMFDNSETGSSEEAPSLRARLSTKDLFDGFAIVMCRPFTEFKESHMKRLLVMNGARVCEHPRELTNIPSQVRICILDHRFYRKRQKRALLKVKSIKYKFVAVRYEWLINSFFLYQVQPLLRYLHDANPEEALNAGVTDEYLED